MKREEVVELLKEANANGKLLEAVDEIFEHYNRTGSHLHDPEFWQCAGCELTVELPTNGPERGSNSDDRNDLCVTCRYK